MILLDATPLQSEHRWRGVGAYLRSLIAALETLPCGETTPLTYWTALGEPQPLLPEARTVRAFRPHRPAQVYWLYNEVALRAALLRLRPRVFFAPDFNGLLHNPFGATVAVLHDLTELKMSLGEQRTPPKRPFKDRLSHQLSDLRWRAYYRKLRSTPAVIAISEQVKRDACDLLQISPERIHVIYHGVDHAHYCPSRGRGRFAGQPPYIVHIGGRNANKNQAGLLRAFARLKGKRDLSDLHLLFAGPWHQEDVQWLAAEKRRLGFQEDEVRHVGYVAYDDLPSLYGNAAAFAFPSLEEGFGLPILEAMASGAPVVTSSRSSLQEVAGHAALLADPLDDTALAAALGRVIKEPGLADTLRQAGLVRAREFSWTKTAQATLHLLTLHASRVQATRNAAAPAALRND